jgi:4-amino-4-deoxy-L-arabinose transferase-like glycosyltransferase
MKGWLRMKLALQFDPTPASSQGLNRRQETWERTFLFLLIAAAFAVRIWGLSKSHFWDETVYLQNAQVICCGKANYSELDSRPPLLSLIFAAVFWLWNNVYAASIATALLNALGAAFLYLSGRMITGRIPAAIASLLLAFSPFFVGIFPAGFVSADTGNSLLADSPALTLILLAFWLLLCALRRQTAPRFACAGFVLALAVLMRFASLSSVGVLFLLVLAADLWWRAALACSAGFAVGIGPYLCWSRLRYGGFFSTFRNGWVRFQGLPESSFFYLKNFGTILSWVTLAGLALWIGRWAWENLNGRGRNHRTSPFEGRSRGLEAFLWLWAVAVFLFFSMLSHKEPRYIMPAAPPLFLLAGSGLSVLLRGHRTAVRVAGSVLLVGALVYTFLPVRERFQAPFVDNELSEEMQISDFLSHAVPPNTVLYSNFNYPVFAWYTDLPMHRLPESFPENRPALYDALNHLSSNGILIAYKNDVVTDPRLGWLDSNPHFRRFREFPSVVLYESRTSARDFDLFPPTATR